MPRLLVALAAVLALSGCAGERLRKTRLPDASSTSSTMPVRGRPGGLDVDFDKRMASERSLRVRVYRTGPDTIEIRMRTTQTMWKCASEKHVRFGVEGLEPGSYRVVFVDNGERSPAITAVVPGGAPRVAGGPRSSRFGGGC